MTTAVQARESVYGRWKTNWTATVHWTFANEKFKPPVGLPWARVSMRHRETGGQTLGPIGSRRFTRLASVFVQLFVPVNTGEELLGTLMQAATDLYEGVSFDGLRFFQAAPRELGTEGAWQTALVEAEFDYDEAK